jgi:hypothetical protein
MEQACDLWGTQVVDEVVAEAQLLQLVALPGSRPHRANVGDHDRLVVIEELLDHPQQSQNNASLQSNPREKAAIRGDQRGAQYL